MTGIDIHAIAGKALLGALDDLIGDDLRLCELIESHGGMTRRIARQFSTADWNGLAGQLRERIQAVRDHLAESEARKPQPEPAASPERYSHVGEMLDIIGRASRIVANNDETNPAAELCYRQATVHALAALVESVDRLADRIGPRATADPWLVVPADKEG